MFWVRILIRIEFRQVHVVVWGPALVGMTDVAPNLCLIGTPRKPRTNSHHDGASCPEDATRTEQAALQEGTDLLNPT